MSFTKQEWNNGTIYRVHVNISGSENVRAHYTVPCDVGGGELTGKVFMGIEDLVMEKEIPSYITLTTKNDLYNYWESKSYLQFVSPNLHPLVDYNTRNDNGTKNNINHIGSSQVFARIPLDIQPTFFNEGNKMLIPRNVTYKQTLNKDSILYEMENNPIALSQGQFTFQVLDQFGEVYKPVDSAPTTPPIKTLAFTLVIYKPRNTYN